MGNDYDSYLNLKNRYQNSICIRISTIYNTQYASMHMVEMKRYTEAYYN